MKVTSDEDISAMKAVAIAQRGNKKDFFDLWYLMKKNRWKLKDVLAFCTQKYRGIFSVQVFLKALVYFEDAEKGKSYVDIEKNWEEVKEFFVEEVKNFISNSNTQKYRRWLKQ